jgi:AraC-like DNA-binding protein/quercetin dioxygenase-like cupin family protein
MSGMSTTAISVRNGSSDLRSMEVGGFRVTDVVFPPGLRLPSHYHERACFAVILEGSVRKAFARVVDTLGAGGVVTMPPRERHRDDFQGAGAHIVVIEPDPAREPPPTAPALFERVHLFRDGVVAAIAWRIRHELDHPDAVTPLALDGLALELVAAGARRLAAIREDATPPAWVGHARELLHARFAEPLVIAEIAALLGVEPERLARAFRHHVGVPIGAYVRRLRLEWTATQLVATERPLSEIALLAGFADQSHFTRLFRRHSGVTPGAWRRAARAGRPPAARAPGRRVRSEAAR